MACNFSFTGMIMCSRVHVGTQNNTLGVCSFSNSGNMTFKKTSTGTKQIVQY